MNNPGARLGADDTGRRYTRTLFLVIHRRSDVARFLDHLRGYGLPEGFEELILRFGAPGMVLPGVEEVIHRQGWMNYLLDPSGAGSILL